MKGRIPKGLRVLQDIAGWELCILIKKDEEQENINYHYWCLCGWHIYCACLTIQCFETKNT